MAPITDDYQARRVRSGAPLFQELRMRAEKAERERDAARVEGVRLGIEAACKELVVPEDFRQDMKARHGERSAAWIVAAQMFDLLDNRIARIRALSERAEQIAEGKP